VGNEIAKQSSKQLNMQFENHLILENRAFLLRAIGIFENPVERG